MNAEMMCWYSFLQAHHLEWCLLGRKGSRTISPAKRVSYSKYVFLMSPACIKMLQYITLDTQSESLVYINYNVHCI